MSHEEASWQAYKRLRVELTQTGMIRNVLIYDFNEVTMH
jgi:hypothetical protein